MDTQDRIPVMRHRERGAIDTATMRSNSPKDRFNINRDDERFSDHYDVVKFIASVHSKLQNLTSDDIVLSYLDDKQRKFVTEQLRSAAYFDRLFARILFFHETNTTTPDKEHTDITEHIERLKENSLNMFLVEINSILALHRNKKDNPLLGLVITNKHDEQQELLIPQERNMLQKVGDMLRPRREDI